MRVVVSNKGRAVYGCDVSHLAVLSSRQHNVWVRCVGGKMVDRISYGNTLVYNTFPFPSISNQKAEELAMCALRILEVRERYPDRDAGGVV